MLEVLLDFAGKIRERHFGDVVTDQAEFQVDRAAFTKYEIVEESSSLRHRHHPGTGGPKFVLQNRDIIKMFDGLTVSESFLLKSNTREILLRKRA